MISPTQNLKQCREQVRKCQSWLARAPGLEFTKLIEDLDHAVDLIEKRIEKVAT